MIAFIGRFPKPQSLMMALTSAKRKSNYPVVRDIPFKNHGALKSLLRTSLFLGALIISAFASFPTSAAQVDIKQYNSHWAGEMSCYCANCSRSEFSTHIEFDISDGKLVSIDGFGRSQSVKGKIATEGGVFTSIGDVSLFGTYTYRGSPRDIRFTGKFESPKMTLKGTRGPYECKIALKRGPTPEQLAEAARAKRDAEAKAAAVAQAKRDAEEKAVALKAAEEEKKRKEIQIQAQARAAAKQARKLAAAKKSGQAVEKLTGVEGRKLIQFGLKDFGLLKGKVDGSFGASTRKAIASYQSSKNNLESGYLTAGQAAALKARGKRLAQAEALRLAKAERKRVEVADRKRKAEEESLAAEAKTRRLEAQVAKLREDAKRRKIEARLAAEAEKKREDEARLAAEAEKKRKEEEVHLAAEAEKKRKEEEARLAAEAEMKRKEEEARLTAEAETKRKQRQARLAAEAETKRKAELAAEKQRKLRARKRSPLTGPLFKGGPNDVVFLLNESGSAPNAIRGLSSDVKFENNQSKICHLHGWQVSGEFMEFIQGELALKGVKSILGNISESQCSGLNALHSDIVALTRKDFLALSEDGQERILEPIRKRQLSVFHVASQAAFEIEKTRRKNESKRLLSGIRSSSIDGYGLLVFENQATEFCSDNNLNQQATQRIVRRLNETLDGVIRAPRVVIRSGDLERGFINVKRGQCRFFFAKALALKKLEAALTRDRIGFSVHHEWVSLEKFSKVEATIKKEEAAAKAEKKRKEKAALKATKKRHVEVQQKAAAVRKRRATLAKHTVHPSQIFGLWRSEKEKNGCSGRVTQFSDHKWNKYIYDDYIKKNNMKPVIMRFEAKYFVSGNVIFVKSIGKGGEGVDAYRVITNDNLVQLTVLNSDGSKRGYNLKTVPPLNSLKFGKSFGSALVRCGAEADRFVASLGAVQSNMKETRKLVRSLVGRDTKISMAYNLAWMGEVDEKCDFLEKDFIGKKYNSKLFNVTAGTNKNLRKQMDIKKYTAAIKIGMADGKVAACNSPKLKKKFWGLWELVKNVR